MLRALITADNLRGMPGLRRSARDALLTVQPTTVLEALALPAVGRKTTRGLLAIGVLTDPEGVQSRGLTEVEWARRRELTRIFAARAK